MNRRTPSQFALLRAITLVAGGLAIGACVSTNYGPATDAQPPTFTGGDRAQNGVVAIDEAGITGTISASNLSIQVPVKAVGAAPASGTLKATITSVDGTSTLGTASLTYNVAASSSSMATVTLPAPASIVAQPDAVSFNLVLDEGKPDGIHVTKSLLYVLTPYDIRLEGPSSVSRGKKATWRVTASDPATKKVIAGIPVQLRLEQNGTVVRTVDGQTQASGDYVFALEVQDSGDYTVEAVAQPTTALLAAVGDAVHAAAPGGKILLTTDKPIYKPGQTLNLRSLALGEKNAPLGAQPVIFDVSDGKGNKVFKKTVTSDSYGIASTKFTVGSLVNEGTFTLHAAIGDVKTEKTVTVSQYALPKFDVSIKTDQPWYLPGNAIVGTIDSKYFFGKVVAGGQVTVEVGSLDIGQTIFQKVMGVLDAQGHYQFSAQLPSVLTGLPLDQGNAAVFVRATVIDTAGQQVQKELSVAVARAPASIVLVPEATAIVPGVENQILIFVMDPLGAPIANAQLNVKVAAVGAVTGASIALQTDAYGQAVMVWTPAASTLDGTTWTFDVTAALPGGVSVHDTQSFDAQIGAEHIVVRTDKSVYDTGDVVNVEITSTETSGHIYVDWLNAGQTVDMRTLEASGGKATFTMPIDASLSGANRVEAYVVDPAGNLVRAGRTIFARNAGSLGVTLATDKAVYAPGEHAKLTFSVADEKGQPTVAALGVQIVDQAVYALVDAHPGLLQSYFELDSMYAKPQYEIHAPQADLSQLLLQKGTAADPAAQSAAQKVTQASLAALGARSMMGIDRGSWQDVISQSSTLLVPSYGTARTQLVAMLKAYAGAALNRIAAQYGCSPTAYYCSGFSQSPQVAALGEVASNAHPVDFWGNVYTATSNGYDSLTFTTKGPDEATGTQDDDSFDIGTTDLGFPPYDFGSSTGGSAGGANGGFGSTGGVGGGPVIGTTGAGGVTSGGGATGTTGGGPTGTSGATAGTTGTATAGSAEPRVRRDFPETLYVNPALITGPDGTASVDLDMADSITEWRVSTLASAPSGRLGGGEAGVKVFQDFFVDISFPATLTRGDEVTFPIAVYNYLDTPQTVALSLDAQDWYTALGSSTSSVDLAPGQVVGVSFPVRVDKVGLQTLTVKAIGSQRSDAVARSVKVVPDGKVTAIAASGVLSPGTASQAATIPADAITGSEQLYVEVYPAYLSQVVSGMDSILQEPNGCFEQTTSTTWPNVLVTAYMQKTHQITPAIQLKAESLISTGYQRLLTFEHPGGGFSWFGTQDPAPFLSVTAFGLMEFADMAKVADVDDAMVSRTRDWMLRQQMSDGSWQGDQSEFFSFQTSSVRNTAFVIWALATGGYQGPELDRGVAFVKAGIGGETDAYTLGLAANALTLAAPNDSATAAILAKLDGMKKTKGDGVYWDSNGLQTSFYQSGEDADVSATALVTHAFLSSGSYPASAQAALKYLAASKDASGNFGSTQATIWTLRTLLLAASKGTAPAIGTLVVSADGQPFRTLTLAADQSDVMTVVDLSSFAAIGSHTIGLDFAGSGQVSYNVVNRYNVPWSHATDPADGPLAISVDYDKRTLYVNDVVKATVHIKNQTSATQDMILVTVGIPPGFQVMTEDFAQYLAARSLSKFELTGKQLILYVSKLTAGQDLSFTYHLQATMPVKADDGGAEAHLYYQPKQTSHAAAGVIEATAF